MKKKSFGEFIDKKHRDSIKQLNLIKQSLESNHLKVEKFTESEEPYIFCRNNKEGNSFEGIRIYKIGNDFAFRIQKESKTHPYGSAYPLSIETMYDDFLSDDGSSQEKAGKKIIEAISKEVNKFFQKSYEAEKKDRMNDIDKESSNGRLSRSLGNDYSSLIYNRT